MTKILNIIQIIISVLLIVSVLLQQRGSGLSSAFGGSGEGYHTKRGLEKIIFSATIILVITFMGLGVFRLFVAQ
ncbi:MAG: preprotein translocase subunit SecG [Patescibacteria group bacterium]|jgi:preprotein translocase subunit SecG|nr:preprotein translocase subunit SecG [Patescibacteria group bacterium]MDD5172675.1 preprotein translocase subunit SecG [Patescibacteria group bacterium]